MATTAQKNIPALRFPGFKGGWEEKSLEEITTKITDGTHDTPKPVPFGVPYLTAIHVKDGFIDFENCYYLPQEEHNKIYKRCNVEFGDLLMVNIGAGTATCALNKVDYEFSLKNVALIKPNKSIIDSNFLEQSQRLKTTSLFKRISTGGAQPFLSLKEIGRIAHHIPPLKEQKKIASFLSSVDERLQQLQQQQSLLEQYKKGSMQLLFSQKLRFKGDKGKSYSDWQDCKLRDILIESNEKSTINNQYKIVSSTVQGVFLQEEYFNKEIASRNNIGYKILKLNQLVFSPQNLWMGNININDRFDIGLVSPSYKIFSFNNTLTSPKFCKYGLFTVEMFAKYEQSSLMGASIVRRNLDMDQFFNITILLPSLEEQTKIANFLSAIDEQINTVKQQIAQTQQFKKGLLQQMFV